MTEHFDITIWRLNGSFENPNHEREGLVAQAGDGEYIGRRTFWHNITPVASGFCFRFEDRTAAEEFEAAVESHELPPEENVERVERQPHEDDDVELVRPNGDVVSVKRKRVENLLKRGWAVPGTEPSVSDEKSKAEKKQKTKKKKKAEAPVIVYKPFEAKDDDWVVMWTKHSFVRVRRNRVSYCESVGWRKGWDLYRDKYHELEKIKSQMVQDMADMNDEIEALQNKGDSNE